MTLLVRHPDNYRPERLYALRVLLSDFLGLDWRAVPYDGDSTLIEHPPTGCARRIIIADGLFSTEPERWLSADTLPALPLPVLDIGAISAEAPPLPVLYGTPELSESHGELRIGLDLFGSAFFQLARYEEAASAERDEHGRFPACASLPYRAGFLSRAVVNEYADFLLACMKRLWPSITAADRQFRVRLSCDVDSPVTGWARSLGSTLRKSTSDIVRRRSLGEAYQTLRLHRDHRVGRYERDPHFTFEWIHGACDRAGLRAAFYFIVDRSSREYDGCYSVDEPFIRSLMRSLHERGHEIGLHGSYHSYDSGTRLREEAEKLRRLLAEEGIERDAIGGRQHYLRWRTPRTGRYQEAAGLAYDSTLGFADAPGFRCGTCYEYPLYDLEERRTLDIVERPLVLMEQSVLSPKYLNLGVARGLEKMLELKEVCRKHRGSFTVLWHNSSLSTPHEREAYLTLLEG